MPYSRTEAELLARALSCPWWVAQSMAELEPGQRGVWSDRRAASEWRAERTEAGHLEVSRVTRWHVVPGEPVDTSQVAQ